VEGTYASRSLLCPLQKEEEEEEEEEEGEEGEGEGSRQRGGCVKRQRR